MASFVAYLECWQCHAHFPSATVQNLCFCGGPLAVRYDLEALRKSWSRNQVEQGPKSMWRYSPALPVTKPESVITLGEGFTPLLPTRRIGGVIGANDLWVKDDGVNPTGSFKARGMACAISMAVELGINKVALPSAGNAASAAAAYAARAGIEANIFMPKDVPKSNYVECVAAGAKVTLVDGLINDCGKIVTSRKDAEGWFEISTQKEPYRVEGKKTMGYELAEQFGWTLPDVILYPTGGGVGLIGMWKAFDELEALGWIGSKRPKMIAVQAAGCQPVVRAYEAGEKRSQLWEGAETVASGLRVPKPLGDFLILDAVRQSKGTAIAVSDDELLNAGLRLATEEGIFAAPEGAACIIAVQKLISSGFLSGSEKIVIYNTGAGVKYLEAYLSAVDRRQAERLPVPLA